MSIFDQLAGAVPSTEQPSTRAASTGHGEPICSRKACGRSASWQLLWNNPRIHTPERRKTWLACSGHREWLEEYLTTRGLWKQTLPLEGSPAAS
ncbi:hypothetical protein GCM10027404_30320 [Arthrobacter tumbae]|uniref:hypothetical protein n=1 Tax=Arthrobacter tumbae TaxID=163874 RepID=UPI001959D4A6|nr:hypothetical protein [Arthrobacter tumbae]MBM7783087.1 hypothetical protein [Arthrobacter tumbae]